MRIARHKDVLKKRVRRFFESPPYERRAVAQVTRELGEVAEVYVFGGLLRDLALYGGANFSSDVDIVVVPHEGAAIEAIAKKFQFKKNKFGGYRLASSRWLFDVWEFDKTWAFVEDHVQPKSRRSLNETTFFNWDAVFYDLRSNQIVCAEHYFDQLANLSLDINLEHNPNTMGMFMRALRFIEQDHARTEPRLTKFIADVFDSEANSSILLYHAEHSKAAFLSAERLQGLRAKAQSWEGQTCYNWRKQTQLEMFAID